MPGDVQVVQGTGEPAPAGNAPEFVDVRVKATGQVTQVPADWIGNPVLGAGIESIQPDPAPEPEPEPEDLGDPPTEHDKAAVIETFAEKADIDLTGASTKAEKVALIDAALAERAAADATAAAKASAATPNPDVQLVAGTEDDRPVIGGATTTEEN